MNKTGKRSGGVNTQKIDFKMNELEGLSKRADRPAAKDLNDMGTQAKDTKRSKSRSKRRY